MLASAFADNEGASRYLWGGFVCYRNEAKIAQLGVDARLLETDGPVSAAVAMAMARGALERSGVDYAVALTGYAGPADLTWQLPDGAVYIAVVSNLGGLAEWHGSFAGDRNAIRRAAAAKGLELLAELVERESAR